MLNFFDNREQKNAFLKAFKEVNKEKTSTNKTTATTVPTVEPVSAPRYTGFDNKPSSEVVDLKHFKDWRKTTKVSSNNPVYTDDLFKAPLSKFDDEKTEEKPIKSVFADASKRTSASKYIVDDKASDRELFDDIDSFLASRKSSSTSEKTNSADGKSTSEKTFSAEEISSAKSTFAKMFEAVPKKQESPVLEPVTDTEEELSKNPFVFGESQPEESLPEVTVEVGDGKTLKVIPRKQESTEKQNERKPFVLDIVIDKSKTAPAKEEKPVQEVVQPQIAPVVSEKPQPKKTVNRKPRGKNKRRFDADVIGAVDWR